MHPALLLGVFATVDEQEGQLELQTGRVYPLGLQLLSLRGLELPCAALMVKLSRDVCAGGTCCQPVRAACALRAVRILPNTVISLQDCSFL